MCIGWLLPYKTIAGQPGCCILPRLHSQDQLHASTHDVGLDSVSFVHSLLSSHPKMLSQLESATVPCRLIVFGDQSSSSLSNSARQLLYSQKREKPNLRYFIDSVNTALRSDVAKLHISDRRWLPQFSTVEELAQRASQSNENAVTDAVLATFHHLCSFIRYGQVYLIDA